MTAHAATLSTAVTCPLCGARKYRYASACRRCQHSGQTPSEDIDPQYIQPPRPVPSTPERTLLVGILEASIADAMTSESVNGPQLRAEAQWWWLDDQRGPEVYGSAAYCCSLLDCDRARMASALMTRWRAVACVVPADARRAAGAALYGTVVERRETWTEAQTAAQRARWTPQARAKQRQDLRRRWRDPAWRARSEEHMVTAYRRRRVESR